MQDIVNTINKMLFGWLRDVQVLENMLIPANCQPPFIGFECSTFPYMINNSCGVSIRKNIDKDCHSILAP